MRHYSVMVKESLEYLAVRPGGVYVDATTGLGGHTREIARAGGQVIALDRDGESLELARAGTEEFAGQITYRQSAFSELAATVGGLGVGLVDGILADLGVSRMQLTTPERGFTLQAAGPLDMRMDRRQELMAADIVNRATERELSTLIEELGEERGRLAEKIARALVRARPVRDTGHLARIVESVVPRTGKLHPATRVFQALRMAVNDEQGELDALLKQAPALLKPGGRWVMIAFQSLDDRKVKEAFRAYGKEKLARVLTKHVVKPTASETRENPASRSAVLRALEKN